MKCFPFELVYPPATFSIPSSISAINIGARQTGMEYEVLPSLPLNGVRSKYPLLIRQEYSMIIG